MSKSVRTRQGEPPGVAAAQVFAQREGVVGSAGAARGRQRWQAGRRDAAERPPPADAQAGVRARQLLHPQRDRRAGDVTTSDDPVHAPIPA